MQASGRTAGSAHTLGPWATGEGYSPTDSEVQRGRHGGVTVVTLRERGAGHMSPEDRSDAAANLASDLLRRRHMRSVRRRDAGFTLIELLVVTSIIGTLAAIAIPQFSDRQGKAFDARVITDVRNAALAEEAVYDDEGSYQE